MGGVLGALMYLIFIHWQLPEPETHEKLSTLSTISDKIKEPSATWEKEVELKAAYL